LLQQAARPLDALGGRCMAFENDDPPTLRVGLA
jgi:hypothetical protein